MKTCNKCKTEKPMDAFPQSQFKKDGSREGDGRRAVCKACANEERNLRMASWSPEKLDAYKKRQLRHIRRWDKEHPHVVKASKANLHAKRVGAEGKVTSEDVRQAWDTWNGKCWVCGISATELDHYRPINCKGGGANTADNIRPICRECNQKRSHRWHGEDVAEKEAGLLRQLKALLNEAE